MVSQVRVWFYTAVSHLNHGHRSDLIAAAGWWVVASWSYAQSCMPTELTTEKDFGPQVIYSFKKFFWSGSPFLIISNL